MNIKITTATFVIVVEEIKETIENIFDESCKSARAHFNAIKCSNMGGGRWERSCALLCICTGVGLNLSEKW